MNENILGVASQMIPMLSCNDCTRNQMADSQMRQAVCLSHPEIPLIKSGYESTYIKYTSSIIYAKRDGSCVFKNNDYIIVKYDDNSNDVIKIGVKESKEFDKTLHSHLNEGDIFYKNDIIAATKNVHYKTGEVMLGSNILIGIYSTKGNYEDAIVISETCAKKLSHIGHIHDNYILDEKEILESLYDNNYIPIHPDGTWVNEGEPIFKLISIESENISALFPIVKVITAPTSGKFYSKIYIKKDGSSHVEMNRWLKQKLTEQEKFEEKFKNTIENNTNIYYPEYLYLDYKKKFQFKTIMIDYHIINDEVPVFRGSKLCNRYGNKGVVSKIVPDEEMPKLDDGRRIELIFNPLSPVARMNISQLYEIHINWASENYIKQHKHEDNETFKNSILKFIEALDSTNGLYYNSCIEHLNKNPEFLDDIRKNGLQIVMPPFVNDIYPKVLNVLKLANVDFMTTIEFPNGKKEKCTVGKGYILKLEQEPDVKSFGRSIGAYGKFGQPPSGANAHRLGEMESWALFGYEANNVITEFYNSKSDNPEERSRLLAYLMDNEEDKYIPINKEPLTKQIYEMLIKTLGLEFETEGNFEEEKTNE